MDPYVGLHGGGPSRLGNFHCALVSHRPTGSQRNLPIVGQAIVQALNRFRDNPAYTLHVQVYGPCAEAINDIVSIVSVRIYQPLDLLGKRSRFYRRL